MEGMAVDAKGEVTASSILESRLQSDLLAGRKIMHASHVRMICYIIKLMEKKGRIYQVILAGPSGEVLAGGELTSYIKKMTGIISRHLSNHDLTVRYTERISVIALFERSDDEIKAFIETLKADCPDIQIETI